MVVKLLESLGYTKEDIKKIVGMFKQTQDETLYNYVLDTFEYFENKGYDKDTIKKMIKKFPLIVAYNDNTYEEKESIFKEDGFSFNEYKEISKQMPSIYSYSKDRIDKKIDLFLKYGYTKEEYINIVNHLPSIIGYSMENVSHKLDFYNNYSLKYIIEDKPRELMQSAELTYSRYKYFIEKGYDINRDTYAKLYYSDKMFNRLYGITKQELLEKYKYSEEKDLEGKTK